jgi:streptogrisin C
MDSPVIGTNQKKDHVRRLRAGTILGVVGALLAGPAQALAVESSALGSPSATPLSAESVEHAIRSRASAEASLNPTAVTYYTQTYGVSEAEARQRLATQTMVPNIEYMLGERLGSALAQVWFDNSTGQWVVAATAAAPATTVGEFFSAAGLASSYRLERVGFNQEQLLAAFRTLSGELAQEVPPGQETVGVGEGQLDVTLAADQPATVAESAAARLSAQGSAPPVSIERSSRASLVGSPEVSCSFPWCNTIVGGDKWYFGKIIKGKEYEFACSAGFYVGSSGDPYPLILTAGHCAVILGDYVNWGTCDPGAVDCGPYGHQIPYYYHGNGGGDAGLLEPLWRELEQFGITIYGG